MISVAYEEHASKFAVFDFCFNDDDFTVADIFNIMRTARHIQGLAIFYSDNTNRFAGVFRCDGKLATFDKSA